jgi:TRAP-type C4-dicarboxylate transport system permease small subunit
MRKRVVFGLIGSSLLIIFSIIMCVYIYNYSTTNRVGVVGDGEFHFKNILTFIFTFLSGAMSLLRFIILAYQDKKIKK